LPVQAGSDRVLMAMKRNHTVLQYKSIIRKLKAASPNLTITSDFIVGFPGETEKDFEASVKLMQDVGFDYSFSFLYSPRPGTPAAFIEDDTSQQTKLDRLNKLQAINNLQGDAISHAMLGTTQRLLIEGLSKKDSTLLAGRTDNNRIVTIAKDDALVGTFVMVKITNTDNPKRLQGELI
jgi:tRNA-2-methylthio-N6-dimethylallyladenosine synthase